MKKFSILIFIILFTLTSCTNEIAEVKKFYSTTNVTSGNISNSSHYIGYTDSFNNVVLSSKTPGRITQINKKVGDRVSTNELIVSLDGSEARAGYSSSSEIIQSLENLKISTKNTYNSQINTAQTQLEQLKTNLELAEIGIRSGENFVSDTTNITQNQINTTLSQIAQAESGLNGLKRQLENTKNSLNQRERDIYANSRNSISNANILANNVIDFLDNLYGVSEENRNKNNSFEIYLGARNSSLKNEAENRLRTIIPKKAQLEEINSKIDVNDKEGIKNALEVNLNFFDTDIREVLAVTYRVLENSVSASTFPESMIQELKNTTTQFRQKNEQVILNVSGNFVVGLKGSLDNIENFEKEKIITIDGLNDQIINAQKQIDILNNTLLVYESQRDGELNQRNLGVEEAQKQKELIQGKINELNAGIESIIAQKHSAISEIDTKISQTRAGLNESSVMINNSRVSSPISGVVTSRHTEIGQVVGAGQPLLTISDDSEIKIEIQISQESQERINIGEKVLVSIDGINELREGVVSKILPSRDVLTKRTTIEIKVNNDNRDIKMGSYSRVYLNDSENEDKGLIIPNNAILQRYMIPGVYILEESNGGYIARFRKIEIINKNDDFAEIIGLDYGDTIITNGKENIYDGEILRK